jgi:hypothetical protein
LHNSIAEHDHRQCALQAELDVEIYQHRHSNGDAAQHYHLLLVLLLFVVPCLLTPTSHQLQQCTGDATAHTDTLPSMFQH